MNWRHKFTELLFEVVIIIFAISVSLFFERQREKSLDRDLEKEFLEGLKTDLESDLKEMEEDSHAYHRSLRGYNYFIKNSGGSKSDSSVYYFYQVFSSAAFQVNSTRFEGLRSSGKLDIIENPKLKDLIMQFYQERVPLLVMTTSAFLQSGRDKLVDYLDHEMDFRNEANLLNSINKTMSEKYPQNLLRTRKLFIAEVLNRYKETLSNANEILQVLEVEDH